MSLASSRSTSMTLKLTIFVNVVSLVIIVPVIRWSIITSIIFFTGQRWSSVFTIHTLKFRLMMGRYFSMIANGIAVTHRVLRIRSWRVSIQWTRMNPKVFLLMPVVSCMFAFDLGRRFRLAIIWRFSLPIRCVRVSGRVPDIHCSLIMLEYLINVVAPIGLDKNI